MTHPISSRTLTHRLAAIAFYANHSIDSSMQQFPVICQILWIINQHIVSYRMAARCMCASVCRLVCIFTSNEMWCDWSYWMWWVHKMRNYAQTYHQQQENLWSLEWTKSNVSIWRKTKKKKEKSNNSEIDTKLCGCDPLVAIRIKYSLW